MKAKDDAEYKKKKNKRRMFIPSDDEEMEAEAGASIVTNLDMEESSVMGSAMLIDPSKMEDFEV